jgi:VanZ family protein
VPDFRSARERRLWITVAVAVAAILAALYPLQFALDALRSRNLLRASIAGLFLVCATAIVGALARRRPPLLAWLVLVLSGAIYAGLALAMEVPQERLHLVEYGALALLVRAAVAESVAVRRLEGRVTNVDVWSLGGVTLIGWLDEAVQGILPNRVYDLRDVGWNALAAGLALVAASVMRAAMSGTERRRERAGK